MATADKLSYLLDTKEKIKNAINNDISLVNDDTIFKEYADKINNLSDTLKKYIPTDIKTGSSIQINNAVPLNAKSLIIDGNSYQEKTKGINLFDYTKINNATGGLKNVLNDDGSITTSGKITSNYVYVADRFNITDIIENGENYVLFQSYPNKYVYIQLNRKKMDGSYQYINSLTDKVISFNADKDNFTEYKINIQSCNIATWGDEQRVITQKYMLCKATGEEIEWELYTEGIASPNPNYPQEIEVIKNISLSNNEDEYLIDLQDNFLAKINDVKDKLNIITGTLDKNIKKYTFTGEENWIKSGLSNEKKFVIALANDDLTNILKIIKNNVICTHFILSDNLNANGSFWLYNWSSSKQMYDALRFSFDINEIDSVEKAKQFFKNNEVIIYYQSISETIQLEPLKIKMYEGTNNIELSSNLETSMQLEYYKDYKANSEVVGEVTE